MTRPQASHYLVRNRTTGDVYADELGSTSDAFDVGEGAPDAEDFDVVVVLTDGTLIVVGPVDPFRGL
jgi:hypothetical protein